VIASQRLYQVAFAAGTGLLVAGTGIGLLQSFRLHQGFPPLAALLVLAGSFEQLLEDRQYDAAVDELQLMLRLAPESAVATHHLLGRALEKQGRIDEAVEHYRRSIALDPAFAEAHNNLGVALARRGDLLEAVAEVRQALRLDPDLPEALQNLPRMQAALAAQDSETPPSGGGSGAPAEIVLGRSLVRQFYSGDLEGLHARFEPAFAAQMPLDKLVEMREKAAEQLGHEILLVDERLGRLGPTTLYVRRARFDRSRGEVEFVIQLGADGRAIAGLLLRPAAATGDAATPPADR
jgi:tetratricopeptide (TPR) repeat protein